MKPATPRPQSSDAAALPLPGQRPRTLYFDKDGRRLPSPAQRARLVGYWLINRVEPLENLTEEHLRWACEQVGLPWADWAAACQRFPKIMADVRRKRGRRAAYLLARARGGGR